MRSLHCRVYRLFTACIFLVTSILLITIGKNAKCSEKDSLLQVLSNASKPKLKVQLLLELSTTYPCDSSAKKLTFIQEALDISKEQNVSLGLSDANRELGYYYERCAKDYHKAINYYNESIRDLPENSVDKFYKSYQSIAACYEQLAQYNKALEYYRKILALDIDKETSIQIFGNSGNIYIKTGDYTGALQSYQKAYNMLYEDMESSDSTSMEDTLTLMGLKYQIANVYRSFPDYERALENYRQVEQMNKEIRFIWFVVLTDLGIGDCYLNTDEYDKAISYYKRALSTLSKEKSSYGMSRENLVQALVKLSEVYYEKENVDSASYYINNAKTIAEQYPVILTELPKVYLILGQVEYGNGKYSMAEKYLLKSIKQSSANGSIDIENEAWEVLSKVYTKIGKNEQALEAYQKHIAIRDSIYSRQKLQELTRIDMQGSFDRQSFKDSLAREEEKAVARFKLQRQRILTYSGFAGLALLLLLSFIVFRSYRQEKKANLIISEANKTIQEEKQVSENLLLNILPEEVAEELKKEGKVTAQQFDNITVLFTDFVNFTKVGERLSPKELVEELHTCFKEFDYIIDKYNIEKIKTIGDAYLAVAGLPIPNKQHAEDILNAALEIQSFMAKRKALMKDKSFDVRIGIHSGSVVAGIVGVKKFAYDIWGDTVNIAARMEQSSEPGRINISEHTHELIANKFNCTYRGEIAAKNKGRLRMYFVNSKA